VLTGWAYLTIAYFFQQDEIRQFSPGRISLFDILSDERKTCTTVTVLL
jgi:hypothetical protein